MKEFLIQGSTLPETYHDALWQLRRWGEVVDCEDWGCLQKECSMTFEVENPLSEPMISKLFIGGPKELEQYRQEMLHGILDFEIAKGNWEYTYHDRFTNYGPDHLNQFDFIISELMRSKSTRRAVILARDNTHDMNSNDPACLQHIQYFIRNNKLYCKVLFRSNDACKATFMNAYALIRLQEMFAKILGCEMGTYTHRANSFHCYEKDFPLLEAYYKRITFENEEDLTYNFHGDWDEQMEDAKAEIKEAIGNLTLK